MRFQMDFLLDSSLNIDVLRCAGCGVCTIACPEGALYLVPRPEAQFPMPPEREVDWRNERAEARKLDLHSVL